MIIRARRLVLSGALAAAATAASVATVVVTPDAVANAAPACLARVTSQGDEPVCVGTSNGQPIAVGSPGGVYGPAGTGGSVGVVSGPLLPGQSWNGPLR